MSATRPGDFSPQAEAYARARPGYPPGLVDRLVALAEIAPGAAVADLGAGTGLFTALLAGRGLRVTAVEPNTEMRARSRPLAGVAWRDGTFEATGLETSSQAWVVAAQAFHWARPDLALPEIHRVLDAGGRLTVLWNNRDVASSETLSWTREAIERLVPGFDEGYRDRDWSAVLTSTGHFHDPVETEVRHVVVMGAGRYLDLWRSHNLLNVAAGGDGMRTLLGEIAGFIAGRERIEVPYRCRAWTARRGDG